MLLYKGRSRKGSHKVQSHYRFCCVDAEASEPYDVVALINVSSPSLSRFEKMLWGNGIHIEVYLQKIY